MEMRHKYLNLLLMRILNLVYWFRINNNLVNIEMTHISLINNKRDILEETMMSRTLILTFLKIKLQYG